MFERFTDRARRVVVLAQEEARRLNHNYIGTEHILLGLIQEGEGHAAKALDELNINSLTNNLPTFIQESNEYNDVSNIIEIITSIRSFKNEIGVSPGSLIDISLANTNSKTQDFFNKNEIVLKKLGRISNILLEDQKKSSASLIIKGELYKMYFEQDVDIKTIKDTLLKKHSKIKDEMDKINTRLSNKSFIDRAPKDIVELEKSNFNNLEKDAKKIQLTLENL